MRIVVIGAGGHAKVVIDALESAGHELAGVIDETGRTAEILGHAVLSPGATPAADGFVIAIGDNALRKARFEHYVGLGWTPVAVVHASATVAPGAAIGPGTVVFAGVVVNPDATIGANVILNTGCTVDHDCVIADHVHVAPGVNLCGGVSVGEGTLLGVGACATPGARIGAWSTIGAGAAVIDEVADGITAVGVPAREVVTP